MATEWLSATEMATRLREEGGLDVQDIQLLRLWRRKYQDFPATMEIGGNVAYPWPAVLKWCQKNEMPRTTTGRPRNNP